LLEISTDKVDSEIPSSNSGVIAELLFEEGETIEVGKVIAYIETESGVSITKQEKDRAESVTPKEIQEEVEIKEVKPSVIDSTETEERKVDRFLSPLVKKIARENQISEDEIFQIKGRGKDGRVTRDDLLAYLKEKSNLEVHPQIITEESKITQKVKPEFSDDRVEIIKMDHIRKAIADHMVRSVQTSPHVVTFAEVDMQKIFSIRENVKKEFEKKYGFKLTYTAFFVEATAKALKEFPYLNSSVENDKIMLKKYYNIGVAVAVGQKLIVPVIKNADQKNLIGIARSISELTDKAKIKKLLPDDVKNGTFSVTNPGVFGNTVGVAIINQPQVAILDCGAIIKRPVVIDDAIAIRPIMWMSLSYDHRIIDGAMASMFTQKIVNILENYEVNGLF